MKPEKTTKVIDRRRLKKLAWDLRPSNRCGSGNMDFLCLVGLSHSNYYRVLSDKNADLSADALFRIGEITGVSLDWLLGLSDVQWRDDSYYKKCIDIRGGKL